MPKRRFIVTTDFNSWRPGNRDSPESYLPMRKGFSLFADIETTDEFIVFDMDAREFETGRRPFWVRLNGTCPISQKMCVKALSIRIQERIRQVQSVPATKGWA
jgi:hypothetical protein